MFSENLSWQGKFMWQQKGITLIDEDRKGGDYFNSLEWGFQPNSCYGRSGKGVGQLLPSLQPT
jgi:hypothetical protein